MLWPVLMCHQRSGSTTKLRPTTKTPPTKKAPSIAGNEKIRLKNEWDSMAAATGGGGTTASGAQASETDAMGPRSTPPPVWVEMFASLMHSTYWGRSGIAGGPPVSICERPLPKCPDLDTPRPL